MSVSGSLRPEGRGYIVRPGESYLQVTSPSTDFPRYYLKKLPLPGHSVQHSEYLLSSSFLPFQIKSIPLGFSGAVVEGCILQKKVSSFCRGRVSSKSPVT